MKLHPVLPALLVLLCSTHVARAQQTDTPAGQENDEAVVAWLRETAIPLRHVEAGNGFVDLEPLKQILKDVRIVGLGEATHGTREFFQIKHRLLEFLVMEMDFNAFAIEASYAACQPINEYVLHGAGDPATVLSGQGYIAWDAEEFAAMLDWLRTYNQRVSDEKRVRFYGLDPVYNDLGREKTLQYLAEHSPSVVSATDSLFQVLAKEEAKWPVKMDDEGRRVLVEALPPLDRLINHLTANKQEYVSYSSLGEFDQILQHIRRMKQFALMNIAQKNAVRSQYKAENVMHLVDREKPDTKFVIWEHNDHISGYGSESQVVGDSLINPYMGYYLREKYGSQYYAFGLDFNQGSFQTRVFYPDRASGDLKESIVPPAPVGSLAWYLSRLNIGNLILDLRTPPSNPVVERWLNTPQVVHRANWGYQDPSEVYTEVRIGRHYDGIIFIEKTRATRPTTNALEAVSRGERF